jgi:ADP-heptose:LPS heptosyltransferase
VVLQTAAGRNDNSFRYFAPTAILNMAQFFIERGYESVLLGGEFKAPTPSYVHNRAGFTSVWEALNILKGSSYFIGHDGFLAYVAMSMKIPSTVIFHDPTLPHHYMHSRWKERTNVMLGSQKIDDVRNILERVSL